jgi:predicted DNA-binding ribbon-helix-helix protein
MENTMLPDGHSTTDTPAQLATASDDNDRSSLVSRNITVNGHRTSVRLEPDMWIGLQDICRREYASLHEICTAISSRKSANTSLTAAIRVFVMAYFRASSTEDGHSKAGHGPGGSFMAEWRENHMTPRSHRDSNAAYLRGKLQAPKYR